MSVLSPHGLHKYEPPTNGYGWLALMRGVVRISFSGRPATLTRSIMAAAQKENGLEEADQLAAESDAAISSLAL
jgi:hypothetical protein